MVVNTRLTVLAIGVTVVAMRAVTLAQEGPGYLAIFGIGQSGAWTTEVSIANRVESPARIVWSLGPDQGICLPPPCHELVDLPGYGSAVVGPPPPYTGFISIGYLGIDGSTLPAVQARVHTGDGLRSADLPVFRVRDLRDLNVESLSFPGARRGNTERCNLLLANVWEPGTQTGGAVEVEVSVVDAGGHVLASRVIEIGERQQAFLVDVVGQLGVAALDGGQVRVRKLAGDVMWGILTVTRSDGSMSVCTGVVP